MYYLEYKEVKLLGYRSKINFIGFLKYKEFREAMFEMESIRESEVEAELIINEIMQRQKERDKKPYEFQKIL